MVQPALVFADSSRGRVVPLELAAGHVLRKCECCRGAACGGLPLMAHATARNGRCITGPCSRHAGSVGGSVSESSVGSLMSIRARMGAQLMAKALARWTATSEPNDQCFLRRRLASTVD